MRAVKRALYPAQVLVPRIALTMASAILALIAIEAVLRLAPDLVHPPIPDYAWMRYDPVFGMSNTPGVRLNDPNIGQARLKGTIIVNDLGFRGEDLQPRRNGRQRVICLGDSSTFGIWLARGRAVDSDADFRADNSYAARLPEHLRARGVEAEVVNAGVLGYNSAHGVRQLRAKLLDFKPDVVIVRFGFNDHAFVDPRTAVHDPKGDVLAALYYVLLDFRTVEVALAAYRRPLVAPAVSVVDFARNSEQMIGLARQSGTRIVFLDYPLRPLRPGETEDPAFAFMGLPPLPELYATHHRYQEALREVVDRRGVPLIETADIVTFSDSDRVHPDMAGGDAIARRLAERLLHSDPNTNR